ncbi:ATP-dependent DNA helicase RecG [Abyssisolibacter fermentans]|uniref:ATP-dependent DNA helicase RecG n=1 Tax=Abyssisolibacter fermentans TaxID=1766203 RepID=UPI00082E68FB|nr:ATP-dependent DNA helicase RecG [Abyssisolibacter fermentans]
MDSLCNSIQYVKGVGPKRAEKLKKLGINTYYDALYYFPRGYEDKSEKIKIVQGQDGKRQTFELWVAGKAAMSRPNRKLTILKMQVRDETATAQIVWFNQAYMKDKFKIGQKIIVTGKIKRVYNRIEIHNPVIESDNKFKNISKITPIYPLTKGIKNNDIIRIVDNVITDTVDTIQDTLPNSLMIQNDLIDLKTALKDIHFPQNMDSYAKARRRLVFEEFFMFQLGLMSIRKKINNNEGIKFNKSPKIYDLIDTFPFKLTNAQDKVLSEILSDMNSNKTMNRLIQGDVGSGKTIIAILAMYHAVCSGYQAVMMAPTEILAKQHYESVNNILKPFGIRCDLLVGSMTQKNKEVVKEKIKNSQVNILIGTHALIQDSVIFDKLGIVITDEQHRFGVRQRVSLANKGYNPDVMVMTATPIPRTLALILYGDLDISVIDELPPGRKPVKTYPVGNNMSNRVYNFVKEQIKEGRQAYIVCPLIEESEALDTLKSAQVMYDELIDSYFSDIEVALIHGKMKNTDKEYVMEKFKNGDIDVLISTTVIEVGINVPNANIMVIENAERFGLAQLHQLRGRVGRGSEQAYCILINRGNNKISVKRMHIMKETNDGFIISQKDLELRGPGDILGIRQHGLPSFKIANVFTDIDILKEAQTAAKKIISNKELLSSQENNLLNNKIQKLFNDINEIDKSF